MKIESLIFWICWFFISFVCAVDSYFLVKLQDVVYHYEENPIIKYIMDFDNRGVALAVGVKIFTTTLVLGSLIFIRNYFPRHWRIIMVSLTLVQFDLLLYLTRG